tara:strand:+ start:38 stop:1561 length:1524 start_codon:yes stop_codon:yes gene_type:complete
MSIRDIVRQVKTVQEDKYVNHAKKVQTFFTESALSKAELQKPAGAGPNSGRPRIEIFADKIKKGEEHILNDGSTIVIKQITMNGQSYSKKDMTKLVKDFENVKTIAITDPSTSWTKIAKTPEYGGKGGGEKISESTQELMTAAIVMLNKTYDASEIDVKDARKIIDDAKKQWGKIQGATGKEQLLNQFSDNWYDLATAVSSANAINKIVGNASAVFWTGQKWVDEIAPYNPPVKGVKDYNSSDIVVKGSDGIYHGFSLKKKQTAGAADPTLINKPITGKKSLLKEIVGPKDYAAIERAKQLFFTRMIASYHKKRFGTRYSEIQKLPDKERGKLIRDIPNDFANDMLAGRGASGRKNIFWMVVNKVLKKHGKNFVSNFLKLVFRIDLNDMINADQFKFYLLTGIGKQKGDAIGVEPAEVKDLPSTIEALTKIFEEDKLKLGNTVDKKGNIKPQPWEYDEGVAAPAKLFYTIYNGSDPLLNIELRYKGSKTAEPQFQATATPVFKNMMK